MLLLWKVVLGLLVFCAFGRIAGMLLRYVALAACLFITLLVIILMAVVVDAQVSHAYRQTAWTLAERRKEMYDAIDFLTTTPSCLPMPKEGWPTDWRAIRRSVRAHTSGPLASSQVPYHFVVDGYSVHGGMPTAEEVKRGYNTIVLYSGGSWAGLAPSHPRLNNLINICACSSTAQLSLRAAQYWRIPVPVVGFNYGTSNLDTLNIGQTDDSAMLGHVYKLVAEAHPTARIVLAGDCLGSLRLLNWMATRPELPRLHGIALESPLPSLRHFLNVFTPFDRCNELFYKGLIAVMPNYRPELETYQSFAAHGKDAFPDVPTFVGVLADDPISHPRDLPQFEARLHQVETFVAHDKDESGRPVFHGQMIKLTSYQNAIRAFFNRIGILLPVPESSNTAETAPAKAAIDPETAAEGQPRSPPSDSSHTPYAANPAPDQIASAESSA
jgi:hypothetical protein